MTSHAPLVLLVSHLSSAFTTKWWQQQQKLATVALHNSHNSYCHRRSLVACLSSSLGPSSFAAHFVSGSLFFFSACTSIQLNHNNGATTATTRLRRIEKAKRVAKIFPNETENNKRPNPWSSVWERLSNIMTSTGEKIGIKITIPWFTFRSFAFFHLKERTDEKYIAKLVGDKRSWSAVELGIVRGLKNKNLIN